MKVVLGVRGPVGEAHSSSHYGRWLLWYFSLSISGGGGGWGEIPRGGAGLGRPSSIFLPPPPPPWTSLPCFSSDSSPSDCYYSPFFLSSITLSSTLSAPSITSSISLSLSHHPRSTFSVLPSLSSFLHFSREAALDSQMSLACQKLLLTFQFSGVFSLAALC